MNKRKWSVFDRYTKLNSHVSQVSSAWYNGVAISLSIVSIIEFSFFWLSVLIGFIIVDKIIYLILISYFRKNTDGEK